MATEPQILSSFSPRACPRCMLTCFSAGDLRSLAFLSGIQMAHAYLSGSSLGPLHLSRTLYKSAPFMQNKPNFQDARINLKSRKKKAYENKSNWTLGENKPNSNTIKACPERSRMGQFPKRPNEYKLTYNKGLQKKRRFRSPKKQTQFKPNTNPKQSQNEPKTNPIKANF